MNADAYLRKQGWKGSGHSLDLTGRGIKKPLLIAHKQDQLGLGKKKAAYTTDDQWWMRAFDQSLQSIGSGKESTLSQIRTQGINRGGLYGFFVKGEPIEGTIEDSSATATDASIPPSGASTPPTSASDTEAPAPTTTMADKKNKRKRAETDVSGASKKKKKAPKPANTEAMAAKIAKLKPAEKAECETRAAAKNQTLEQYILRRIQKKAEKRAAKYVESPSNPPLFFTDLEGDPNLLKLAKAAAPIAYTPLSNGKCPLDPAIWEGRAFMSLPQPVKKAQREYKLAQRIEKRFGEQEEPIQRALGKMGVESEEATEEQREEARDIAKRVMSAKLPKKKKSSGKGKNKHNTA